MPGLSHINIPEAGAEVLSAAGLSEWLVFYPLQVKYECILQRGGLKALEAA